MGSEYYRKNQVGCKAASRASFAPTDLMGVRPGEPGRLLGRLGVDVDLGHAEPRRGAEWWGKALLVTFGWSGSRLFQK
jgi:hypothetical protein